MKKKMKLAVVTSIVGGYDLSCKPVAPQTEYADFFVYTDNLSINTHDIWKIIDISSYRFGIDEKDRDPTLKNSLFNNQHTFNIAKFIKLNLHRLPELKEYDILVWLDGTIEITNSDFIKYCNYRLQQGHNFIIFEHSSERGGILKREVIESCQNIKYNSTFWLNQNQPSQDVNEQYIDYIREGFEELYFDRLKWKTSPNYGVWVTCFLAVNRNKPETSLFFDHWWYQNMKYTTQDQVSFSFLIWKLNLKPLSQPLFDDKIIFGNFNENCLFRKWKHGV